MAGHQRWFSGKTGVTDLLCEDEGPARRHFEIPDCIALIPAHHTRHYRTVHLYCIICFNLFTKMRVKLTWRASSVREPAAASNSAP